MRRPLGVGIVGLSASGGWAARAHVPAINAVDGVELRALAASNPAAAERAGQVFGVAHAADARSLAERDDVDLLVVSVKVPHHHELVSTALESGKHVLCEWPLGNGLAETEDLAERAATAQGRGFIGLQGRSAPVHRHLRDLVTEGFVGDVLSTSLIGTSGAGWGATCDSRSAYIFDRANGATLLTIPVGHAVDVLTFVLGEFERATGTTACRRSTVRNVETGELLPFSAPDQVAVHGTLVGGPVASLHVRGGQSPGDGLIWQVDGTEGTLLATADSAQLQYGTLRLQGSRGHGDLQDLPVPSRYEQVPALRGRPTDPVTTLAHAYLGIRDDLETGGSSVPDFAHAVLRHRFLAAVDNDAAHSPTTA